MASEIAQLKSPIQIIHSKKFGISSQSNFVIILIRKVNTSAHIHFDHQPHNPSLG